MKHILSFILVFLLNLPNCGMVFAGDMDTSMNSSGQHIVMIGTKNQKNFEVGAYSCCPHSATPASQRNTPPMVSQDDFRTTSITPHYFLISLTVEDLLQHSYRNNRPTAPPDPSEYCSLVGSVKLLD